MNLLGAGFSSNPVTAKAVGAKAIFTDPFMGTLQELLHPHQGHNVKWSMSWQDASLDKMKQLNAESENN